MPCFYGPDSYKKSSSRINLYLDDIIEGASAIPDPWPDFWYDTSTNAWWGEPSDEGDHLLVKNSRGEEIARLPIGGGGGSSTIAWLPDVSESGDLTWKRSSTTIPPTPQNIKGTDGKDGEAGKDGVNGKDAHSPYIGTETGTWFEYDDNARAYLDTNVHAQGPRGIQGAAGKDGKDGVDGQDGKPGSDGTAGQNGADGIDGENGATFKPLVNAAGDISWTNDKGLENPTTVNIRGPKGKDGTGVTILGSYSTEAELRAAHPSGVPGDAYLVAGDLYVWSNVLSDWDNVGRIQGPDGETGKDGTDGTNGQDGRDGENGATFTPSVNSAGDLSWTNDKGIENPVTVNIKGPKGDQGKAGNDGRDGDQGPPGNDGSPGERGRDGTTFIPAVSSSGVMSWSNSDEKENPDPVDLSAFAMPTEGGEFTGMAKAMSAPAVEAAQLRNIYAGTEEMESGVTELETGAIYFTYE